MPASATESLELTLVIVTIASFLLSLVCLIRSSSDWLWRVLAGCGAVVCFAGLVSFDLWQNSVEHFPRGAFPRGRGLYLMVPAVAVACIARGVIDAARARNKATTLDSTGPSATPPRRLVRALVSVALALAGVVIVMGLVTLWDTFTRPTPMSFQGRAAPDFMGGTWINAERPLGLSSLKGKVVLVQFTFIG
jgi:hypothetical protein